MPGYGSIVEQLSQLFGIGRRKGKESRMREQLGQLLYSEDNYYFERFSPGEK